MTRIKSTNFDSFVLLRDSKALVDDPKWLPIFKAGSIMLLPGGTFLSVLKRDEMLVTATIKNEYFPPIQVIVKDDNLLSPVERIVQSERKKCNHIETVYTCLYCWFKWWRSLALKHDLVDK